jgi:hypothetical protein
MSQSGEMDRRGPLSKHGARYLRWGLMEAAIAASSHPLYKERYQPTISAPTSSSARSLNKAGVDRAAGRPCRQDLRIDGARAWHRAGQPRCRSRGRERRRPRTRADRAARRKRGSRSRCESESVPTRRRCNRPRAWACVTALGLGGAIVTGPQSAASRSVHERRDTSASSATSAVWLHDALLALRPAAAPMAGPGAASAWHMSDAV